MIDRRNLLKIGAATVAAALTPGRALDASSSFEGAAHNAEDVERWGMFEIALHGPSTGNPFKDVAVTAAFTQGFRTIPVKGFYDGDGVYRIRFMPDTEGQWKYTTESSTPELQGHSGEFRCTPPSKDNHGPVLTAHRFHFQHADETPYFPFGTTTYAFLFANDQNAAESIAEMKQYFNKSRVCILPKPIGEGPQMLPFPNTGAKNGIGGVNDYTRFNPEYFQLLERRLMQMQQAGVQADCILFHPYDAWGYKSMPDDVDDFYLRYVIARIAAFRHVWWSIANEYDLIKSKTTADWDRFFRIVQTEDPYGHLRSIHHSVVIYDNSKPWCTHASLQAYDFDKSAQRLAAWNKPIIYDEIQYEGDIERRWGNLSAEEMTHRFWMAVVNGVYASHGEVFMSPEGGPHTASWSDAGPLRGDSAPRIKYLHDLVASLTNVGLFQYPNSYYLSAGTANELYLWYFDYHRPARYTFPLPATAELAATIFDPYAMTSAEVSGSFHGKSALALPNKPYRAVVFKKTSNT